MLGTIPRAENPYIAGNPVGGSPAFVGRNDLLREVYHLLRNRQNRAVVLHGQRRIGKTSILHHLMDSLAAEGEFRPVYFDLQDKAKRPLGDVIVDLAHSIASELKLASPSPDADPASWFTTHWLPTVLKQVPDNASLVILFDEFDVLADVRADHAASNFFPYLRGLLSETHGRIRFVFVIGRNIDDLASIAKSLFKGVPDRRVSLLLREDAEMLVRMSEANGTLAWQVEAIEEAWALTNGHPFLLQHLCWQVWEHACRNGGSTTKVGVADVTDSVPRTLDTARNALGWLWDGLSPAARVVASALAGAGNRAISQEELEELLHESGVRVVMRELRDAPQLLEEWDLIEPTEGGYRFRVELLRQWIAKFKPLSRMQQNLDLVEPRAENLYRVAALDYKEGNLEVATTRLREALASNPNHARASELLADILISRQRWTEALQLLEQLHENYPGVARARLAQVLLALADVATDEDQRLVLLERVLEVQRKHSGAESARRQIWTNRGDRARAAGRLADAIEAYRHAGLDELEEQLNVELRKQELDRALTQLKRLEADGDYAIAYESICQLAERFPEIRESTGDLVRLRGLAALDSMHSRAQEALAAGDRSAAIQVFIDIIARAPNHRNVTARLHQLVTGVDVDALSSTLKIENEAHAETERQRLAAVTAAQEGVKAKSDADAEIKKLKTAVIASENTRAKQERDSTAQISAMTDRIASSLAAIHQLEHQLTSVRDEKVAVVETLERSAGQRRALRFWLVISVVAFFAALWAIKRTEDRVSQERISWEAKRDRQVALLVNEGSLVVTSMTVSSSVTGPDGKCSDSNNRAPAFPMPGTCWVYFQAKLQNNLANAVPLKGPLCVMYIGPDEAVRLGAMSSGEQGGKKCSFEVKVNEEANEKSNSVTVSRTETVFEYSSGWGNGTGNYYDVAGTHRIELWWQNKRIGEATFVTQRVTASK